MPVGTVRGDHLWKRFRSQYARPLLRDHLQQFGTGRPRKGDWTWVLKDVNLHVQPGESIALVGLNGSGKSTLLKLLSRVMYPNAGSVNAVGRLGALIEVRAGIHPDLTGRENVFFYGTVLGLTRRQVAARFDDIIQFAELEDAVDRQVKFYSSGMQMRLGFGIAAFLEPDILLVDEVLAVGDVGFQQRCLERMRLVLQQGTTLVFVSHDMAAVEAMCARAVWLDRAVMVADGPVEDVLLAYRKGLKERADEYSKALRDPIRVAGVASSSPEGENPLAGGPVDLTLTLDADGDHEVQMCLGVSQGPAQPIFILNHDTVIPDGMSRITCRIASLPLPRGRYYLWAAAFGKGGVSRMGWQPVYGLDVEGQARTDAPRGIMLLSPVHVRAYWTEDADVADLDSEAARSSLASVYRDLGIPERVPGDD